MKFVILGIFLGIFGCTTNNYTVVDSFNTVNIEKIRLPVVVHDKNNPYRK
jgi:hypothetical protein